jgi:coatomer protein complex subunit alpha (xenin)
MWRMNDTKAWEVDTMRGHVNNVSCVMFHPRNELIVSNSEDRSIRVWDMSKRVGVQTFRREADRFWILAAHSSQNLLAAGHDSGMIVFKLERERPASDVAAAANKLYYVKGRELLCHDYALGREVPIANLRRPGQYAQTDGIGNAPRYLAYNPYNPTEGNVLVCSDVDGGNYELHTFGLGGAGSVGTEGKRGSCIGPAVFIARNRFAVLDKNRHLLIKNLENETTKKVVPPSPVVDGLFSGGTAGRLLLRAEDKLILFEQQVRSQGCRAKQHKEEEGFDDDI